MDWLLRMSLMDYAALKAQVNKLELKPGHYICIGRATADDLPGVSADTPYSTPLVYVALHGSTRSLEVTQDSLDLTHPSPAPEGQPTRIPASHIVSLDRLFTEAQVCAKIRASLTISKKGK